MAEEIVLLQKKQAVQCAQEKFMKELDEGDAHSKFFEFFKDKKDNDLDWASIERSTEKETRKAFMKEFLLKWKENSFEMFMDALVHAQQYSLIQEITKLKDQLEGELEILVAHMCRDAIISRQTSSKDVMCYMDYHLRTVQNLEDYRDRIRFDWITMKTEGEETNKQFFNQLIKHMDKALFKLYLLALESTGQESLLEEIKTTYDGLKQGFRRQKEARLPRPWRPDDLENIEKAMAADEAYPIRLTESENRLVICIHDKNMVRDVKDLEDLKKSLKSEVRNCVWVDVTQKTQKTIEELEKELRWETSWTQVHVLIVIVRAHGKQGSFVIPQNSDLEDEVFWIQDLLDMFHRVWRGIPKFVMTMACQGEIEEKPAVSVKQTQGVEVVPEENSPPPTLDAETMSSRQILLPPETLLVRIQPGRLAWTSILSQSLCDIFSEKLHKSHLLELTLDLNRKVCNRSEEMGLLVSHTQTGRMYLCPSEPIGSESSPGEPVPGHASEPSQPELKRQNEILQPQPWRQEDPESFMKALAKDEVYPIGLSESKNGRFICVAHADRKGDLASIALEKLSKSEVLKHTDFVNIPIFPKEELNQRIQAEASRNADKLDFLILLVMADQRAFKTYNEEISWIQEVFNKLDIPDLRKTPKVMVVDTFREKIEEKPAVSVKQTQGVEVVPEENSPPPTLDAETMSARQLLFPPETLLVHALRGSVRNTEDGYILMQTVCDIFLKKVDKSHLLELTIDICREVCNRSEKMGLQISHTQTRRMYLCSRQ